MNPIIRVENLTHTYGQDTPFCRSAVKGASLEIMEGEFLGIIGHTGSGKSTLMQQLNGLLKPTSGKILLDGVDIWSDKKLTRQARFRVGLVFQYPEYQLFEETVYKDIAFGPKNMGMSEEEIDKAVREAISYVGLDESYLEKSPFDLSGGEKRRVAIAGVMAMKPEVLILDEPAAGLDPKGRETVLSLITSYREKTGSTVLVVSHSMEDISKIATKVIVMNNSELAYYDTVDNVFTHAPELYDMGLNVPQLTMLFLKLKEKGYNVPTNVYTLQNAKEQIVRLLSEGDKL